MKRYINLLPPEQQQSLRLARISGQIRHFGLWLVMSLVLLTGFLFAGKYFLAREQNSTLLEIAQEKQNLESFQELKVKQEVEAFNKDLANFQVLANQAPKHSAILQEFAKLLPSDVTVDSFEIKRDGRKVEASGRAGSRASVLRLRGNLLASENFVNVNFPLTNLEKARDVSWKYRFYIGGEKP